MKERELTEREIGAIVVWGIFSFILCWTIVVPVIGLVQILKILKRGL